LQFSAFLIKGSFNQQLTNFSTAANEISLCPTDKYITIQNKKLDLAPIPIATPAPYALSLASSTWLGRILALLKSGNSAQVPLTGGIFSRTVATFFIYLLRKNPELKIHFFSGTDPSQIDDLIVAKALAQKHGLPLNRPTSKTVVRCAEQAVDLWRDLQLGTSSLIRLPPLTDFNDAMTFTGGGGGRVGLLNVLLAEGLNLGLSKMAEATNTHDYFQLSRLSSWHIESDAINRALAIVIKAQSALPMAQFWGGGMTASSDGQFSPPHDRARL
jgi:hypothetical protein